jgi:GAF domain-containing protein
MNDPLQDAVESLTRYFVGDATLGDTLDLVCALAIDAVKPAVLCGISMSVDGRIGTWVFSHPEVIEIDRPQYDTGDGPCIDAFRTGVSTLVRSTTRPGPYPDFRAVAASHGVGSVLSSPMLTDGETVGALNLYAHDEDAFDEEHAAIASQFASQAGFLLANSRAYWDARTLSENLEQAMESRAEIEQAKGVIMGATGCTADEAFDKLREQSQYENIKLRDLAAEVVRRSQR